MENLRNQLLLGDTLEVLRRWPEGCIDLAITSPPYNKQEKNRGWLVKEVRYHTHRDTLSEKDYQAQQIEVLDELYRVMKPGGSFFYNHKLRWQRGHMLHPLQWIAQSRWDMRQEIIWDRQIAGNIRGWRFWQVEERIYWLHKPKHGNRIGAELAPQHALLTSIWRIRPEQKSAHPAPFPVQLPTRVIASLAPQLPRPALVLDPYVGSGTTAIAAKHLGHDYVGIDNCEAYLAAAAARIAHPKADLPRMQAELALHRVEKTFRQRKAELQNRQPTNKQHSPQLHLKTLSAQP